MRLPSLNALRAFEAAARHESFSRAASELCVTEGAISRHIKLLEEELGVLLFHRLTRRVELTQEGQRLFPILGSAFSTIATAANGIASRKADLRIVSAHTLSLRWLVPRLEKFRKIDPGFDVELTTKFCTWDEFVARSYDVGLTCTVGGLPKGIKAVTILPLALTPACAPQFLDRKKLKTVNDLAKVNLLHASEDFYDWRKWAKRFCPEDFVVTRGEVYPNRDMAAQAAMMGEGVTLSDLTLMQEDFDNGKLVAPFPDLIYGSVEDDYHFVCPEERWKDARVVAFFDWLNAERKAS